TRWCPATAARWSGLRFLRSRKFGSAPAIMSALHESSAPRAAATWRADSRSPPKRTFTSSVAPAVSRVRTIFSLLPNAAAPSSVRPWQPRQPACPLAPASISRVKRSKFPSAAACSRGARSHSFHCSGVASLRTSLKISISKPSSRERSSSSRFEPGMVGLGLHQLDYFWWCYVRGLRCIAGRLCCLGWQE
ncbi:unnamed protein product, partial [Ectocarpus sp. 13 AM-2016]